MRVRAMDKCTTMTILITFFAFVFNAQLSAGFDNATAGLQVRTLGRDQPPPTNMGHCALYQLDHGVPEPDNPQYSAFSQIQADGWEPTAMGLGEDDIIRISLSGFCQANGCNIEDFERYAWEYMQDWKGFAGFSVFSIWINKSAGIIAKVTIRAPSAPWTDPDQPASGPVHVPLHRPSDYIFLCWKQICGGGNDCMKNLQWTIDLTPSDYFTTEVMEWYRINYAPNQAYGDWPGTQDGPAVNDDHVGHHDLSYWMVGTPTGMSTVWLLLDHQESLGGLAIDQVNLFQKNLAFHIIRNDGVWL